MRKDDFGRPQPQYLIKWKGVPASEASWVPGTEIGTPSLSLSLL
ncbi:hypothetical protein GR268_44695 [Rhizobium leguminosarum]|nr:hypothetical protein [Rhizobium leguminosarum]